jgi:hypothetical protein
MAQIVDLWSRVQEVQLNDQQNEIRWHWTEDGKYSEKRHIRLNSLVRIVPLITRQYGSPRSKISTVSSRGCWFNANL